MEAYIYTYVNKETGKTYIGSRSAYKGSCYDDFNIKYFSSSKDKQFRQDMADGKLEGLIVLIMNDEKANKKIIDVEYKMILAYWEKYGKESSYNHYARDHKWSTAGTTHICSEETKKKLREKRKLYVCSEETKKKLSDSWDYNKHFTEETRKKLSESLKGENSPLYGKKLSDLHKKKLSDAHKGQVPWMKGKTHAEESKKKMSEAKLENPVKYWKGKQLCEETKKKLSEAHKGSYRVYDNDEHTKWHMEKNL